MTATVLVDSAGALLVVLLALVAVRLVVAEPARHGDRRPARRTRPWDLAATAVSVLLFADLAARVLTAVLR